ncbi:uncharacterized protein TRIADDRAFT_21141 [Trichoplax adhaerens]|uniref:Presequence protease, mitochondrial n=1 Tax=Trichoplax adhaerens TaxID=10228 RepID=B3RNZ1_TRIAD|nr:hypothetical protein TRIADDRAFT_21141 [Trichoplax adhaerens]EDV28100.1 hypothetical protein TRIADDRAFT_21141 [Trichoplax adhaerens]|eukprot:XP_002109934.1 hypothetical protein TRIADDRAFT_21141 [Trichoplax adhaerens]
MAEKNYQLLSSFRINNQIPIHKYKSKLTGVILYIAEVDGPLVNGYFCLATEAHDDDGLPHTLEHLVFMGSKTYPYKGVLDLIANRCFAQGTNAWTDTDHTCYTVTTAGSEGFLNLLNVYLDHVLYPTLTESSYITEVHHITNDGDDAGVVYCEMQARENTGESRARLAFARDMYPGHCGYKSETGGILENLRSSTSHQKVCDYHRSFYRPDNLGLIITGQIKPQDVFQKLESFEKRILQMGKLPTFDRPWQSPVPPISSSVYRNIQFPNDDDSVGLVIHGWRGCSANDYHNMVTIGILFKYLTDTPVAPLQRDMVEIDEPYCNDIGFGFHENSESCIHLHFKNVPTGVLNDVKPKMDEIINKIATGQEPIDMTRLQSIISTSVLEYEDSLEDSPHNAIAGYCIADFLYSKSIDDLRKKVDEIEYLDKLKKEPTKFWLNFMNKYLISSPSVTIVAQPSKDLGKQMTTNEKQRVEKQIKELGSDRLEKLGARLDKAVDDNDVDPPDDLIRSFDVPNIESINFHPVLTFSNCENMDSDTADIATKFNIGEVPLPMQLDCIRTRFFTVSLLGNTSIIGTELKPYLSLLLEVIFESPVLRGEEVIPYEEVIKQLHNDIISMDQTLGFNGSRLGCGSFAQAAVITLKADAAKYDRCVKWMHELVYRSQITAERLKSVGTKIKKDIARMKRSGGKVAQALMKDVIFNKECNQYQYNMIRQSKFLKEVLTDINTAPAIVIEKLEKLRRILFDPSNVFIHITCDLHRLPKISVASLFSNFVPSSFSIPSEKRLIVPEYSSKYRTFSPTLSNIIVGVSSVESSFLIQNSPCVNDYNHPDCAPLMVFIEYLIALEGPMWRQIRGLGLSYHYSMHYSVEHGLLYLKLFKSTQLVNAYREAKTIVESYVDGRSEFDEVQIESAKSSVIFEIIEREETASSAAEEVAWL